MYATPAIELIAVSEACYRLFTTGDSSATFGLSFDDFAQTARCDRALAFHQRQARAARALRLACFAAPVSLPRPSVDACQAQGIRSAISTLRSPDFDAGFFTNSQRLAGLSSERHLVMSVLRLSDPLVAERTYARLMREASALDPYLSAIRPDSAWHTRSCHWPSLPDAVRGSVPYALHHVAPATDPSLVAYYKSFADVLTGRRTTMRPGRYLRKYFADRLTSEQVRDAAHAWGVAYVPPRLYFIEDDDPTGWEHVYEHGHEFTSCMVYDRAGRHLDSRCHGPAHPVRAYARAGNGLRLVFLSSDEKVPEDSRGRFRPERVTARAIVRGSSYLRVYGDDRLAVILHAAGYRCNDRMLDDVELTAIPLADDEYAVPYLDGGADEVDFDGDCFTCTTSGDYTPDSTGTLVVHGDRGVKCAECGDCAPEVESCYVESIDGTVCTACLDEYFTLARTASRSGYEYMRRGEAIIAEDGTPFTDPDAAHFHDYYECPCCWSWHSIEYMLATPNGWACSDCAVKLDFPTTEEECEYSLRMEAAHTIAHNTAYKPDCAYLFGVDGYLHHRELEGLLHDGLLRMDGTCLRITSHADFPAITADDVPRIANVVGCDDWRPLLAELLENREETV